MIAADTLDFRLLNDFQRGFPLLAEPWAALGEQLGCSADAVLEMMGRLYEDIALLQKAIRHDDGDTLRPVADKDECKKKSFSDGQCLCKGLKGAAAEHKSFRGRWVEIDSK